MNKKQIIEAIHQTVGFSKQETGAIVDSAFELVKGALARGDSVMISSFGKFSVRERKARKGRNPQTGEAMNIPARKVATFKASRKLKERINEPPRGRHSQ